MVGKWYYTTNSRTMLGPFTTNEMRQRAASSELKPSHMARKDGTTQWAPAGSFPELFTTRQGQSSNSGVRSKPSQLAASPASIRLPDAAQPVVPTDNTFGRKVRIASALPFVAVWSVTRGTWQTVSRALLRRKYRRLLNARGRFLVDLGVQLLTSELAFPRSTAFLQRFRQLSQEHQLAQLAGQGGDKAKLRDAIRSKDELRNLAAEVGEHVLETEVPFEGRAEQETRWRRLVADLARTRAQLDAAVSGPGKRRVVLGLTAAALMVIVPGVVAWWVWSTKKVDTLSVAVPPSAVVERAVPDHVDPQKPQPKLQDMFVRLSPAVAMVEAVEFGTASGFLVKHEGKYIVVTNRHVIENASNGVIVHFPLGEEKRFSVPKSQVKVVVIHRNADLALLDVTESAAEINKLGIEPVRLAPTGHHPKVGEHVFAIGHPAGGSTGVLTSTLSDGIVSAIGRRHEEARYLQITTPINPGNSGGPLFDDEGRVVGVNSFIIRGGGRNVPLEALNFSLEADFIHEALVDPSKSLDAGAIAAIVNPQQAERFTATAKVQAYLQAGYRPALSTLDASSTSFRLRPGERRWLTLRCDANRQYAIVTTSQGVDDLDLYVYDGEGSVVAGDNALTPAPEVRFVARTEGAYWIFVRNSQDRDALVSVTRLRK